MSVTETTRFSDLSTSPIRPLSQTEVKSVLSDLKDWGKVLLSDTVAVMTPRPGRIGHRVGGTVRVWTNSRARWKPLSCVPTSQRRRHGERQQRESAQQPAPTRRQPAAALPRDSGDNGILWNLNKAAV